ncbi:LPS assembly protein LptD [Sphingobium sufflavum]|uniref:LPS-assembly protein LptD n=1 Tax=Sphingobium sufflavum TaxID=1129547 RepID=UPI001F1F67A5|nr:LPS assembly protein LptD [Sphingobium sufflavum]MCE7797781.1 LPS assembly protein LptD [Sphingobium sufflavum]
MDFVNSRDLGRKAPAASLALLAALGCVPGAQAQDLSKPHEAEAVAASADAPKAVGDDLGFTADELLYDNDRDVVTATGNVLVSREGNVLRADMVTWDRASGKVVAKGDVSITNPNGDIAYGDVVEVTDSLKDGIVKGLLLVTQQGDRIAAEQGERRGAIFILNRAAYSPCRVVDDKGCPKEPSWQIKAARVLYDSDKEMVRYTGARLEMFGLPLVPLPGLAHPVGNRSGSGFLVPEVGIVQNGLELAVPYYFSLAPNRDLTVTPHVYTKVLPMIQGKYRQFMDRGAFAITGYLTHGRRSDPATGATTSKRDVRGYIDASGKFQLSPEWSISGSLRRVTDRTFLNRYNINYDDRLRSHITAERIGDKSYLSIAGWAFQTLRPGDPQGQVPIALPAIDYRLRLRDPWMGGTLQLQANSLAITRTAGQDTQRAFVGAQWSLRRLTGWGQEVALTGYARGDVYHSSDNSLTNTVIYRGTPGWQTRGIAALAADVRWPFVGQMMGGTQHIVPRVQLVAAPALSNLDVPNEDARAVDLDDSNLFALNRFPGYDRFEDSSRITYGVDYRYDRPYFSIEATVGQSYRLNNRASILPNGTGLSERFSDFVGRTDIRYRDFLTLTHRFRLDKDNLAVRRNEVDATIGSRTNYARISYLRLNRNVTTGIEDLRDVEEVRLGGRLAIARYWSVFGSTSIDLTGVDDDAQTALDGYTPLRHHVGVAYEDDCINVEFTWRREYQSFGDAQRGNSFLVRLAFRNLGI